MHLEKEADRCKELKMTKIAGVEVLIYLLICDMEDNEDELKPVNTDYKNVHAEAMEMEALKILQLHFARLEFAPWLENLKII